jgi:hypothetical protein
MTKRDTRKTLPPDEHAETNGDAGGGGEQAAEEQDGAVAVAEAPPDEAATADTASVDASPTAETKPSPAPEADAANIPNQPGSMPEAGESMSKPAEVIPAQGEVPVGSRDIPDKWEQARRERELFLATRMDELREDVDQWEEEKADLAKRIKGREEEIETLRKELCGLIRGIAAPSLFDGVGNAVAQAKSNDVSNTDTSAAATTIANEEWKSVLLTALVEFGALEKVIAKIAEENEIHTFGDYAAFTAQPGQRITDLAGVGEATAEKLQDAEMKFWAAHPEYTKPAPAAATEAPAAPTFDFVKTFPPLLPDAAATFFEREEYDGALDNPEKTGEVVAGFHEVLIGELVGFGNTMRRLEQAITEGKNPQTGRKLSEKQAGKFAEELGELKADGQQRLNEYVDFFGAEASHKLMAHVRTLIDAPELEIHTPEQLGLTADAITAHANPHVLTPALASEAPTVKGLLSVQFEGDDGVFRYLNVGPAHEPGAPAGTLKLVKLFTPAEWEQEGIEILGEGDDVVFGTIVKCEGETFRVGPRADALFVKVEA